MTAETSCVGIEASWNRAGHTAPGRTMASRTTHIAHVQVSRVVKVHPEAFQPREGFHCAGAHVSVANGANGTLSVRELLRVTSDARHVSRPARQIWSRCIAFASMTQQTRHARVIGARVEKLRVVVSGLLA
ncbi:MAG TPA: hypothetical protein VFH15_15160 [Pyrinomonadaceae bacterium]|nr:hypothetical protein [Pyrinomonadaceae bacterium]